MTPQLARASVPQLVHGIVGEPSPMLLSSLTRHAVEHAIPTCHNVHLPSGLVSYWCLLSSNSVALGGAAAENLAVPKSATPWALHVEELKLLFALQEAPLVIRGPTVTRDQYWRGPLQTAVSDIFLPQPAREPTSRPHQLVLPLSLTAHSHKSQCHAAQSETAQPSKTAC